MVPVSSGHVGGGYQSSGTPNGATQNAIRVVYTRPEHYSEILPFTDNNRMGELLGFPGCCRGHFNDTWGKGQVDSTWDQVSWTKSHTWQASTLMRWMGVRMVPHMPCSYDCPESVEMGQKFYDLGVFLGYREEMEFAKEMLSWPVLGTRLFGIAEYTSPALKLVTRTDWTPTKDQFVRTGTYVKPETWWWSDNQFLNADSMRHAHRLLIHAILEELPYQARVLDLGCGNGALLRRLKTYCTDITIGGIDINETAIAHAKSYLTGSWQVGRIETGNYDNFKPTTVIINPVRLMEMTEQSAVEGMRNWLRTVPQVFLYSYNDGNLERSTAATGLTYRPIAKTPHLTIGLATWQTSTGPA